MEQTMNSPIVTIVSFTGHGHQDQSWYAARLLAFTKNTRLKLTPDGFDDFLKKPQEEIAKELDYMSSTIASAWEFAEIVFSLQNVSRACAQQITRTRNASYQMQSQRTTDMSQVTFHIPNSIKNKQSYIDRAKNAILEYQHSVAEGESLEDARGLLPMNVHCNLIAKYNLRSLVELLRARDSLRVQGEYREVARQMKQQVLAVWPWSAPFFASKEEKAIKLIEDVAGCGIPQDLKMRLAKAADIIKKA